jgi:hypothetical protein
MQMELAAEEGGFLCLWLIRRAWLLDAPAKRHQWHDYPHISTIGNCLPTYTIPQREKYIRVVLTVSSSLRSPKVEILLLH